MRRTTVAQAGGNRRFARTVAAVAVVAVAFGTLVAGVPRTLAAADVAPATLATPTAFDPAAPAAPSPPAADTAIKAWLDQGGEPMVAGERMHPALLRRFYAAHGYVPFWDAHRQAAKSLRNAVLHAGGQGLDPNLFHAAALTNPAGLSPIDRELLLSDAFLSYAEALARGAVPAAARGDDEALSPGPVDVAAALNAAVASPDPAAAIDALAPSTPQYAAMRRAYQAYRAIAAAGGWPHIAANDAPAGFRPLQQRLAAEGYLAKGYGSGRDDDATTQAVRAFQKNHGLEVDGVLGPATIAELDVGAEARAQQIAVNLERMRWLPHALPATRVWVNTASQHLEYFQDDRPAFRTRVVVGEPDKQTPEFQATIDSLLYNPPWNVPYSIATQEILPKLEDNPDYLAQHNMVMRDNGAIEQLPGHGTALGQLKFEMQDRFDVYLHDTPEKYLFARANRRQSHGCVRVQNPRALAALLLGAPVETINKGIARGETSRRPLPAPVPVFIVYQTAYVGADGRIEFRRDAYHRDDAIWHYLVPSGQMPLAGRDPNAQRHG